MLTKQLSMPQLPRFLERLLADPPPAWVLEFSEQGIYRAATADPAQNRMERLPAGALLASPIELNLRDYDAVQGSVQQLGPAASPQRDTSCALILPDYCVRVSMLEFEDFPSSRDEQEPLVRFRLKKIVPYDLDSARLSFQTFARSGGTAGVSVLASVCPLHVLAEYEALLRTAGYYPGFVSSSALATLELLPAETVSVLAKLSGRVATVAVSRQGVPRLFRTVEMTEVSWDELLSLLQPTFALVEDQMETRVEQLWLAGFEESTDSLARDLQQHFGVETQPVSSAFGAPRAHNAGALGYLEGIKGIRG